MAKNRDMSHSRIVKMPQLHDGTKPAEIWFEAGLVYFQDPEDLAGDDVRWITVARFAAYLEFLWECLNDEYLLRNFVCGTDKVRKFFNDCVDLLSEVKNQLHVGMDIDLISKIEMQRASVSVRPGFGSTDYAGNQYKQTSSGLYVPSGN